jgi:tetratricopeptide (TPR) repeat protein
MAELINWERELSRNGMHADALQVLRVGLTLAPTDAKLLQNRKALVHEIVMKEVTAGNYADALSKINEHKEFLGETEHSRRLILMVVDTEAQDYCRKKDWKSAVRVYGEAIKKLPGDGHLINNLIATYDSWAQTHMQTSDWAGAIGVYEQALTILPGNGHLANNLRYSQEQLKSH